MRSALVVVSALLCSASPLVHGLTGFSPSNVAQGSAGNLRAELEALHATWFKAFDTGDGAALDQMEADNLLLVMPDGTIWPKTTARAGNQPKRVPQPERTLTDVVVRQFGDTAVLTGILTTKSAGASSTEATTVVFVRRSGKWIVASAQWGPTTAAR
jgi:ketosteroid isomerase-like protein